MDSQMKFPHPLCELDKELAARWRNHYELANDRDRKLDEGLWRRTQDARNADESGWRNEHDCRRRLIHYRYKYDIVAGADRHMLCLTTFYLMYCVTYPCDETETVTAAIGKSMKAGGWSRLSAAAWARGDLRVLLQRFAQHPMDLAYRRSFPDDYRTLEITIKSHNDSTGAADRGMPWDVLGRGMRIKDSREDPILVPDLRCLADYLPFHLEVGCGLSTESRIPPLHFLHDVYQVSDRKRKMFVLDPAQDDFISQFLASPESVVPRMTHMYLSCFLAEPSAAHYDLKTLFDRRYLIGPAMTNNFDSLLNRVGIEELYLRRYDQDVPPVSFHPAARALLVIGSHADRRRVQRRARAHGMPVFFIDPEGFWEDGTFIPYPLEGTRHDDILCRDRASSALQGLLAYLAGRAECR